MNEVEDFEEGLLVKVLRGAERKEVFAGTLNGRKLEHMVEENRAADRAPAVEAVVRSILAEVVYAGEDQ